MSDSSLPSSPTAGILRKPAAFSSKGKSRKSKEFKSKAIVSDDDLEDDDDNENDENDDDDEDDGPQQPDAPPFPNMTKTLEPGPPEFSWSTLASDPALDLWLIRLPPNIKPKHLDGLTLDLSAAANANADADVNAGEKAPLGSLQRHGETYEIRDVGDAGGAEEMGGLQVLLRQEEGKGKGTHVLAPRPITRRLVITQSLTLPTPPTAGPSTLTSKSNSAPKSAPTPQPAPSYTIASMRPPARTQPTTLLTHRFLPVGVYEPAEPSQDQLSHVEGEGAEVSQDVEMADVPVADGPKKKEKERKKKRESAFGSPVRPMIEPLDDRTEGPTSGEKPKKVKKRKSALEEQQPDVTLAAAASSELDVSMNGVELHISGETKKKKKKKRPTEEVAAAPVVLEERGTDLEKKKKKKRDIEGVAVPVVLVEEQGEATEKRKKKKRESTAVTEDVSPSLEKKSKKRKHEEGEIPTQKKPKHSSSS